MATRWPSTSAQRVAVACLVLFGLLLATALVAGYHFAIWRRDRAASPTVGRTRAIDRVILVSSGDTPALAAAVGAATGAAVTQWVRADGTGSAAPEAVVQALPLAVGCAFRHAEALEVFGGAAGALALGVGEILLEVFLAG